MNGFLINFLIYDLFRGQIVMIGLLTRYARTQFLAPFDIDSPIRHNIKNKISNASDNNDDQSYEDNQLYKTVNTIFNFFLYF